MTLKVLLCVIQLAAAPYAHDFVPPAPSFQVTLTGIIAQESSLCRRRSSRLDHHAYGCAGLHVATATQFAGMPVSSFELMHRPILSVELGARVLHACVAEFGDWQRSVSCYRQGAPWVEAHGVDLEYVTDVHHRLKELGYER